MRMIGLVGTLVLVPVALVGLAIGFVRFGFAALTALAAAAGSRLTG